MSALLFAFLASWCADSAAKAQQEHGFRILYAHTDTAFGCPSNDEFIAAVRAEVGDDAVRDNASDVISVHIDVAREGELMAELRMWRGANSIGQRTLDHYAFDCQQLFRALVLAVASAVYAEVPAEPAAQAQPEPTPTPSVAQTPEPEPTTTPVPFTPELSFAPLVTVGGPPGVSVGGELSFGLNVANFGFGVRGRAHLPSSTDFQGGSLTGAFFGGGAYAAYRMPWFYTSLRADVGAMTLSAQDLAAPNDVTNTYADLGLRAGVPIPVHEQLFITPWVEGAVALARTRYLVGEQIGYRPFVVAFHAGVSLTWKIMAAAFF